MKKILSLVLAALMLLGTVAFADGNMTNVHIGTVQSPNNFAQTDSASEYSGHDSASQRTDVWLQVEASGQIDVTVPLVAVFKTNIDGGTATISENYQIINYSTAALKVTGVEIVDWYADVTTNGVTSNMELIAEIPEGALDKYSLTMLPEDQYKTQVWSSPKNVALDFTGKDKTYSLTADTKEGAGLWRIERASADDHASYVNLTLSTSPLTFVTSVQKEDTTEIYDGVKLFTITYTVKIDDSTAIGDDIAGEALNDATYQYPNT